MNPIDLTVIAVYVAGCTALGAWLGSRSQGLKGYFLGESNIPRLGRDDLDRGDRDEHCDLPERPGRGLQRRLHVPATGLRVSAGAIHRRHRSPAGLFSRADLHRLSIAAGSVRRPDPDNGLDPLPGRPLARRRPAALPRGDGAPAPDRLVDRRSPSWPWRRSPSSIPSSAG